MTENALAVTFGDLKNGVWTLESEFKASIRIGNLCSVFSLAKQMMIVESMVQESIDA